MESTTNNLIVWKNLSFKEKCMFVFFSGFASLWFFIALVSTWKNGDLTRLQSLFIPFAMLGYLLNPLAFKNPKRLNKSHFPQITKMCFAVALFFLCVPLWGSLFGW